MRIGLLKKIIIIIKAKLKYKKYTIKKFNLKKESRKFIQKMKKKFSLLLKKKKFSNFFFNAKLKCRPFYLKKKYFNNYKFYFFNLKKQKKQIFEYKYSFIYELYQYYFFCQFHK